MNAGVLHFGMCILVVHSTITDASSIRFEWRCVRPQAIPKLQPQPRNDEVVGGRGVQDDFVLRQREYRSVL